MTDDEVFHLAAFAGFEVYPDRVVGRHGDDITGEVRKLIELAAAAERERCALTVRELDLCGEEMRAADAIRALK